MKKNKLWKGKKRKRYELIGSHISLSMYEHTAEQGDSSQSFRFYYSRYSCQYAENRSIFFSFHHIPIHMYTFCKVRELHDISFLCVSKYRMSKEEK